MATHVAEPAVQREDDSRLPASDSSDDLVRLAAQPLLGV
jgi:hypothetical protein